MSVSSLAVITTQHADRYIRQLCKHWQHSLSVDLTDNYATILFPKNLRDANWPGDGQIKLVATPSELTVDVHASSEDHLTALQQVIVRHLDRFAFREAPLPFDWR